MKRSKLPKHRPGSEGMRFVKIDAKTWIEVHESINEDQARKEYLSKIGRKEVEFVPRI